MKNITNIIFSTIVVLGLVPSAYASKPYIGAEAIQTNQSYTSRFGKRVFKKNPQNYALFAGFNFARYVGMEVGYEMQPKRSKIVTLRAGDALPGQSVLTGSSTTTVSSSIRSNHPYLGFFGECRVRRTKYDALIAMSVSHVKAQHAAFPSGLTQRNYSKTKAVPMFKLSVTHSFARNLGVRFSLNYRNMQAFKITSEQSNSSQIKLKDSFGLGLGLTYSFY